jgi:predicted DNA-binding transcriptional regulator YafY
LKAGWIDESRSQYFAAYQRIHLQACGYLRALIRMCNPSKGLPMSFVTTQPEALAATAASLAGVGATMSAQNAAAAAPTTGVLPAAADEVSALAATQFAVHAQMYQAISAQAEAIHQQFVSTLGMSATSYAATETANAIAAS